MTLTPYMHHLTSYTFYIILHLICITLHLTFYIILHFASSPTYIHCSASAIIGLIRIPLITDHPAGTIVFLCQILSWKKVSKKIQILDMDPGPSDHRSPRWHNSQSRARSRASLRPSHELPHLHIGHLAFAMSLNFLS